jgi:hypothetical protein
MEGNINGKQRKENRFNQRQRDFQKIQCTEKSTAQNQNLFKF